ncbi:MAG: FAD-dependent oxidoreductase [Candidatus Omnitrophota bacterium]|nr:FAD-dependent oxidoreductase [Candidatus Omnitrophota bacterium]
MDSQHDTVYDIAIIGGGIAGAGIARDASLRGISVILFEQATFGSGTSCKTSKLIHGGIRYLETAWHALKRLQLGEFWKNFRFVFLALRETHILERIAPELVRPIPLVIPIYKKGGRNKNAVIFGSMLYGLMANCSGGGRFPKVMWNKEQVLALVPNLNPNGLVGGVLIWDHTTDDQRLVQVTAASAVENGAKTLEQARVVEYGYREDLERYVITIEQNGGEEKYQARKLINATGPWVDHFRRLTGEHREDFLAPVAGSHIEVKKFTDYSVILEAQDGRVFFVINRHEIARVGTTEWFQNDPEGTKTPQSDVNYLLRALRAHFPEMAFSDTDILSRDTGIRPLARSSKTASPSDISREHEIRLGPSGVLHILGVKLTDHRRASEEIVDTLIPEIRSWKPEVKKHTLTRKTKLQKSA